MVYFLTYIIYFMIYFYVKFKNKTIEGIKNITLFLLGQKLVTMCAPVNQNVSLGFHNL
jgi:hypothetical protein